MNGVYETVMLVMAIVVFILFIVILIMSENLRDKNVQIDNLQKRINLSNEKIKTRDDAIKRAKALIDDLEIEKAELTKEVESLRIDNRFLRLENKQPRSIYKDFTNKLIKKIRRQLWLQVN